MAHFFISYSRKDTEMVEKIVDALSADDLLPWIDWKNIPKGEEVQLEIHQAIAEADVFLFFVSPDSAQSRWCIEEIDHAAKNRKRILPIVVRDADLPIIHPEISKRNWVFCREGLDDFNRAIEETRKAIFTDYEWLKFHTELQIKALKWEQKRDNSRLLRGKELRETDKQIHRTNIPRDPVATDIQRQFVLASIKHEVVTRRLLVASSAVILSIILVLTIWPFLSREQAIPGNWVSIHEGSFKMGMDQEEADFVYFLCSRYNVVPDNCFFTSEELLGFAGKQDNAFLSEFMIMDNEVTIAQYQQCVTSGFCQPPDNWTKGANSPNEPATNLNWLDSAAYCTWLGGRLPSESEWEKAARGPNSSYFPWGDEWDNQANLEKDTVQRIDVFAESDISDYGVKNMAGNVREWTASERPLQRLPEFKNLFLMPEDYVPGMEIILRGGAWNNDRSAGITSNVGWLDASLWRNNIGFRCVCPEGQTCESPWDKWWVWFGDY